MAKNIVFSQEQTWLRKVGEIFAAYDLEKNYTKNEIFELYVNTAYFGDGYYGIYDASYGYYNKAPKDLNLDESTMLAGVPNAPSVYSPSVNPDLAKKRQYHVINTMIEYGYITNEEAEAYILKDISSDDDKEAVYEFVDDDNELDTLAKLFSELIEDTEII